MKIFNTLLFSFCSTVLLAQPTITSEVMGNVGETIELSGYDADGFDPGSGGANVTWDFTTIAAGGFDNVYTIVDASSTPYAADFTGANVAFDIGGGTYAYASSTTTEYSNYGVATAVTLVYYSDPEKIFQFPMNYEATFTDELYSEFTSGVDFVRSGSVTTTCDGWGTLKLPSGTYTNVMRIVVEEDYQDESILLPEPITYHFINYYWAMPGLHGPLMTYSYMETTSFGSTTIAESGNTNDNAEVVAIADVSVVTPESLFPNPNDGNFTIDSRDVESVEIYNMTGQLVFSEMNPDVNEINSGLVAGMYFAILRKADGVSSIKFEVQ